MDKPNSTTSKVTASKTVGHKGPSDEESRQRTEIIVPIGHERKVLQIYKRSSRNSAESNPRLTPFCPELSELLREGFFLHGFVDPRIVPIGFERNMLNFYLNKVRSQPVGVTPMNDHSQTGQEFSSARDNEGNIILAYGKHMQRLYGAYSIPPELMYEYGELEQSVTQQRGTSFDPSYNTERVSVGPYYRLPPPIKMPPSYTEQSPEESLLTDNNSKSTREYLRKQHFTNTKNGDDESASIGGYYLPSELDTSQTAEIFPQSSCEDVTNPIFEYGRQTQQLFGSHSIPIDPVSDSHPRSDTNVEGTSFGPYYRLPPPLNMPSVTRPSQVKKVSSPPFCERNDQYKFGRHDQQVFGSDPTQIRPRSNEHIGSPSLGPVYHMPPPISISPVTRPTHSNEGYPRFFVPRNDEAKYGRHEQQRYGSHSLPADPIHKGRERHSPKKDPRSNDIGSESSESDYRPPISMPTVSRSPLNREGFPRPFGRNGGDEYGRYDQQLYRSHPTPSDPAYKYTTSDQHEGARYSTFMHRRSNEDVRSMPFGCYNRPPPGPMKMPVGTISSQNEFRKAENQQSDYTPTIPTDPGYKYTATQYVGEPHSKYSNSRSNVDIGRTSFGNQSPYSSQRFPNGNDHGRQNYQYRNQPLAHNAHRYRPPNMDVLSMPFGPHYGPQSPTVVPPMQHTQQTGTSFSRAPNGNQYVGHNQPVYCTHQMPMAPVYEYAPIPQNAQDPYSANVYPHSEENVRSVSFDHTRPPEYLRMPSHNAGMPPRSFGENDGNTFVEYNTYTQQLCGAHSILTDPVSQYNQREQLREPYPIHSYLLPNENVGNEPFGQQYNQAQPVRMPQSDNQQMCETHLVPVYPFYTYNVTEEHVVDPHVLNFYPSFNEESHNKPPTNQPTPIMMPQDKVPSYSAMMPQVKVPSYSAMAAPQKSFTPHSIPVSQPPCKEFEPGYSKREVGMEHIDQRCKIPHSKRILPITLSSNTEGAFLDSTGEMAAGNISSKTQISSVDMGGDHNVKSTANEEKWISPAHVKKLITDLASSSTLQNVGGSSTSQKGEQSNTIKCSPAYESDLHGRKIPDAIAQYPENDHLSQDATIRSASEDVLSKFFVQSSETDVEFQKSSNIMDANSESVHEPIQALIDVTESLANSVDGDSNTKTVLKTEKCTCPRLVDTNSQIVDDQRTSASRSPPRDDATGFKLGESVNIYKPEEAQKTEKVRDIPQSRQKMSLQQRISPYFLPLGKLNLDDIKSIPPKHYCIPSGRGKCRQFTSRFAPPSFFINTERPSGSGTSVRVAQRTMPPILEYSIGLYLENKENLYQDSNNVVPSITETVWLYGIEDPDQFESEDIIGNFIEYCECSGGGDSPDLEFVYDDTDCHPNEISELYSYTEQCELSLNVRAFEEQMEVYELPPSWQRLSTQNKQSVVMKLLNQLEISNKSLRMRAARCILYLAQGCWAEMQSDAEQLHWARANVMLLYRLGTFSAFTDLLNIEIENSTAAHVAMRKIAVSLADSQDLRVILSVLYTIAEVVRNEQASEATEYKEEVESFVSDIAYPFGDELMVVKLLGMVTKFCSGAAPHFPMKKVLLLLWKLCLVSLGGMASLRDMKAEKRKKADLPTQEDTMEIAKTMRASSPPASASDLLEAQNQKRNTRPFRRQNLMKQSSLDDHETLSMELDSSLGGDNGDEMNELSEFFDRRVSENNENNQMYNYQNRPSSPSSSTGLLLPRGLPWKPKVRQKEIDLFLDNSRLKFVGYSLDGDSTTLAGLPLPIHEGVKILKEHVYTSLAELQIKKEEEIARNPFSTSEGEVELTPTEILYQAMFPNLPQYMIALLKILLAAAPTSKAKTDSINIMADVLPEEMPKLAFGIIHGNKDHNNQPNTNQPTPVMNASSQDFPSIQSHKSLSAFIQSQYLVYPQEMELYQKKMTVLQSMKLGIDVNRHKEIIVKAVSAILLLLLKHFKLNHVYQFEFMSQHLVFANCIPLVLKFFNQNIMAYVGAKNIIPILDFPSCVIGDQPELTAENLEIGDAAPYSWRNMFSCINLLRILNKLTKWKHSRIMMLVVFKSAPILKRTLKVRHAMTQLYVLKLLKMQTKYLGRQWRKSNMKTISAIYQKVRHRLNDDWAFGNDLDARPWDFQAEECALRGSVDSFNNRRYSQVYRSDVTNVKLLNIYLRDLNHSRVICFCIGCIQINQDQNFLQKCLQILLDLKEILQEFEPVDNCLSSVLGVTHDLSESFTTNYELWLEQEVFSSSMNWDELLETDFL